MKNISFNRILLCFTLIIIIYLFTTCNNKVETNKDENLIEIDTTELQKDFVDSTLVKND